jgi:hypothetical protein
MYVIEEAAGAGKTTLALHVMLAGRVNHERGLWITTAETLDELLVAAQSHGWSLAGIDVLALSMAEPMARPEQQQTLFRSSHVELDGPFPAVASPLGQESGPLSGVFPSGVCRYHPQTSRPIGIGS